MTKVDKNAGWTVSIRL